MERHEHNAIGGIRNVSGGIGEDDLVSGKLVDDKIEVGKEAGKEVGSGREFLVEAGFVKGQFALLQVRSVGDFFAIQFQAVADDGDGLRIGGETRGINVLGGNIGSQSERIVGKQVDAGRILDHETPAIGAIAEHDMGVTEGRPEGLAGNNVVQILVWRDILGNGGGGNEELRKSEQGRC